MAAPKVFVSSTCYDLAEERSQLERFIVSYGFQPVLSEYGDVFYDPDEHTHNACVKEVAHCDLFILIISGRFGGQHIDGDGESITQAEYNAARRLKIPIFSFIKSDVLNAQLYYKENIKSEGKEFAERIKYPSIHKQDDAVKIFNFIQSVQYARENNAIESYLSFSDIENHLRKQWAAQFYKFLKDRKGQLDVEHISSILEKLSGSSNKLESLVESLHNKNQGEEKTQELLNKAEIYKNLEFFWYKVKQRIDYFDKIYAHEGGAFQPSKEMIQNWSQIDPENIDKHSEYLLTLGVFKTLGESESEGDILLGISDLRSSRREIWSPTFYSEFASIQRLYESGVKLSSIDFRKKAIITVFDCM